MYFNSDKRFDGTFSRDNLNIFNKDGAYIINLDKYDNIGTHWVAIYLKNNNVTYFDSFGIEYIPKEITKLINDKSVKSNIFRIQSFNSILCGYFYTGFIEYTSNNLGLNEYAKLFLVTNVDKNDQIILDYFNIKYKNVWNQKKKLL